MSHLPEKAIQCEFEKSELNERLIEIIILSTPYKDFRKELLIKPKRYDITNVIERARDPQHTTKLMPANIVLWQTTYLTWSTTRSKED